MSGAGLVLAQVSLALLGVAAALCLYRAARGPSSLDRVVALDVFLVVLAAAVAVRGAGGQDVILLVVISLLGVAGSVTAARLVERRRG